MSAGAIIGAISRLAGSGRGGQAASGAVEGTAGAITKLAGAGKMALGSITSLASSITGGLLGPLDHVKALFDTIGNLVGLFNPGIVAQFTLALNDTLAVLGSALVPVMQGMTIYVRAFGDALAGLLPVIQPLFDAIGQYVANYAQGFLPVLQAAAPFIQLFADAMSQLIGKLSTGVAFFQGVVAELLNTISALFGLESRFNSAASSRGFAARQTKVSSVSQFAEDVFASTAKNVYNREGGGKKPEALLEEIKVAMVNGKKAVEEIRKFVEQIAGWFTRNANPDLDPGKQAIENGGLGEFFRALRKWGINRPW